MSRIRARRVLSTSAQSLPRPGDPSDQQPLRRRRRLEWECSWTGPRRPPRGAWRLSAARRLLSALLPEPLLRGWALLSSQIRASLKCVYHSLPSGLLLARSSSSGVTDTRNRPAIVITVH